MISFELFRKGFAPLILDTTPASITLGFDDNDLSDAPEIRLTHASDDSVAVSFSVCRHDGVRRGTAAIVAVANRDGEDLTKELHGIVGEQYVPLLARVRVVPVREAV